MQSAAILRWWPLAVYLIIALLYTLPLPLHFHTHIPGDNGDSVPNLWPFWYFPQAMAGGFQSFFHTTLQFFPDGVHLVYASNSAIGALAMSPVSLLAGPVAALNLWLILHIWLGGWFFNRFCRELGVNTTGAFLGGFAFMCAPFVTVHLPGHYTLVQIAYPAAALYSLALLTNRSASTAVANWRLWLGPSIALGLSTWAVAATDFYLAVMTVFLLLPAAAVHLVLKNGRQTLSSALFWKGMAAAIGVCAVMLLPWVFFIIEARQGHEYVALDPKFGSGLVARWTRLVSLPQYHPIWGPVVYDGDPNRISIFNEYTYLGMVALFVAFVGMIRIQTPRLIIVWVVAFLLALGFAGGNRYSVEPAWKSGPLAFGKWWPQFFPFSEFRVPSRWQFALCASLAVGVAMGTDALLARMTPRRRMFFAALIFSAMAFDYVRWPLPMFNATPLNTGLTNTRSKVGTALDVPVGIISGQGHSLGHYEKETLMRQMSHGMPVLSANVSRLPKDLVEKRRADRELMAFFQMQKPDENTSASLDTSLGWPGFRDRYNITAVRIPQDWPTSAVLQKMAEQMSSEWKWKTSGSDLVGEVATSP